jgi:hypothetical protein
MEGMLQEIAQACANILEVDVKLTSELVIEPRQIMRVTCYNSVTVTLSLLDFPASDSIGRRPRTMTPCCSSLGAAALSVGQTGIERRKR